MLDTEKKAGEKMICPIEQRPSKRLLRMWQSEGAVLLGLMCALGVLTFLVIGKETLLFSALVLSFSMFAVFIYLPQLWKSMTYQRRDGKISVSDGVVRKRTRIVYRNQVQFVTVKQNIFERLFGISTLRINTPGGETDLRGLTVDDAKRLCDAFEGSRINGGSGVRFGFLQNGE